MPPKRNLAVLAGLSPAKDAPKKKAKNIEPASSPETSPTHSKKVVKKAALKKKAVEAKDPLPELVKGQPNMNPELCAMLKELEKAEFANGENYKAVAYKKAAAGISSVAVKITSGAMARRIPGIGEKIAEKIDEFLSTGTLRRIERDKGDSGLAATQLFMTVHGFGPVVARKYADKGISTLEELAKQPDLNESQRIGLKYHQDFQQRIPRSEMEEFETKISNVIAKLDGKYRFMICGSYRRGLPTSGDIDLLITHPSFTTKSSGKTHHIKIVVEALQQDGAVLKEVLAEGPVKFMGMAKLSHSNVVRRIDIRLLPHDEFYCGTLYFTGSDVFNVAMRNKAIQMGFTLSEHSLRPVGLTGVVGEPLEINSEEDVFKWLEMDYKPPSERN